MGRAVSAPESGSIVSVDLGTMKWHPGVREENSDLVESINSLATRIFFDFCRDQFWITAVKQKIQSKLATIHVSLLFFILHVCFSCHILLRPWNCRSWIWASQLLRFCPHSLQN